MANNSINKRRGGHMCAVSCVCRVMRVPCHVCAVSCVNKVQNADVIINTSALLRVDVKGRPQHLRHQSVLRAATTTTTTTTTTTIYYYYYYYYYYYKQKQVDTCRLHKSTTYLNSENCEVCCQIIDYLTETKKTTHYCHARDVFEAHFVRTFCCNNFSGHRASVQYIV